MSEKKYNKNSLQGTVYVLLSAICFSLGGVLIKSIPWNSLSINMVRSVLSFILIFAYQRTQGRKFVFNKMVLLGAVLNFVMALTFVMATKMTTAANAIVLQFTEPVFLILIVWIVYRQKPKKDAVLTCILVLCGIFCFFFESLSTGGDFESSLMVSHLISIVVGIPFLMRETVFTPTVWGYVLVLGTVQFGLSYVFLSRGLDRVSPVTASLTSTIEPILNPILVAIFCGETIGVLSIFGAVLVIGSATVYNLRQAKG